MRRAGGLSLVVVAALTLAACAAPSHRAGTPELAAQQQRERALEAEQEWGLVGRIAFFDGEENGSGRLEWHQRGERYEILISAPVSRQSWRVRGDASGAVLEGLEGGPRHARSADRLLERETGWRVPLDHLQAWTRGLRASDEARLEVGADGLPRRIVEDGWTVDYRDWHTGHEPALPRRVFAQRGEQRVRLAVERWLSPDELAGGSAQ